MKSKLKLATISLLAFTFYLIHGQVYAENTKQVVDYNQTYTYEMMVQQINQLVVMYPGLIEKKNIGKTKYGRDIWAVKLGKGRATVFINGSHHAREWMTSTLNMYMIEQYAKSYQNNTSVEGYKTREVLNNTSIWFVPMVNPDGVTLQQKGLNAFPRSEHASLLKMNEGSYNFKKWKANAQGIDLNRQYPAGWNTITKNATNPFWQNHKGSKPLEAIETKSLATFTYQTNPEIAVSYHASGRILYWNYKTPSRNLSRDTKLATKFSSITKYSVVKPTPNPSGGGYSDWFIQEFGKPAFTPEISYHVGNTHVPLSVFPEEWKRNKSIGLWIASEGYQLWYEKNKDLIVKEKEQLEKQKAEEKARLEQEVKLKKQLKDELLASKEEYFVILAEFKRVSDELQHLKDEQEKQAKTEEIQTVKQQLNEIKNFSIEKAQAAGELTEAINLQKQYVVEIDGKKEEFQRLGQLYQDSNNKDIHVYVNGKEVIFDSKPITKNYRTMIPIRAVSESMGANVYWKKETGEITITKNDKVILLTVGQKKTIVNGIEQEIENEPVLQNNRTLVPLRFINEALGTTVDWQETGKIVTIHQS